MANAAQTTLGLVEYYAGLLVKQYIEKPKAVATVETNAGAIIMPQTSIDTITFPLIPTSGSFVLTYDSDAASVTINWNDSLAVIQAKIRSLYFTTVYGGNATTVFSQILSGGNAATTLFQNILNGGNAFGYDLSAIVVTGSIASGTLTVTFDGVTAPAALLVVLSSSLLSSSTPVTPIINEIDLTLPLAVQNGYQITGSNLASGAQLDVIGKYEGVTRTAAGFTTQITLDDADFTQLIIMAIARNTLGSSLSDIQSFIHQFFPGELLVFDHANMHMSYMLNSSIGSQNLVELFITEGLLPKPMGVQLDTVIYAPIIDAFFGMRTYELPAFNVSPLNSYSSYTSGTPWLSYADAITI